MNIDIIKLIYFLLLIQRAIICGCTVFFDMAQLVFDIAQLVFDIAQLVFDMAQLVVDMVSAV
jgi:hypothetical protein